MVLTKMHSVVKTSAGKTSKTSAGKTSKTSAGKATPSKPRRRLRRVGMPPYLDAKDLAMLLKYGTPYAPRNSYGQGDAGLGPMHFRGEVTDLVQELFPGATDSAVVLRFLQAFAAALENMSIFGWMAMSFRRTGEELAAVYNSLFPESEPVDYSWFYCSSASTPDLKLMEQLQHAIIKFMAAPRSD
jgi:hypothetical protein